MADNTVSTDFKAVDHVSATLKGMGLQVDRFSKNATSDIKRLSDTFKGSFLGSFSANMLTSGLSLERQAISSVHVE